MEFASFLSPTAQPGKNKKRLYTVEDMKVLSLVAELKDQGLTFSEVHAALGAGERGATPILPPEDVQVITTSDKERQLSLEIERLHHQLIKLQSELNTALEEAKEARRLKEENVKLQTSFDHTKQQLDETQRRLDETTRELQQRIELLSKEVGEAYARGYIEALKGEDKK